VSTPFFDLPAEERAAVYDAAEQVTGRAWHDLDADERARFIEGPDPDGGEW
jgi:hypothetical protein